MARSLRSLVGIVSRFPKMESRLSVHHRARSLVHSLVSGGRAILMCSLLLLSLCSILLATDIVGTNGDDVLFFQGVVEQLTTTLTNPYSGETIAINDIYNVNTATYDGLGGTDILLMTNFGDYLALENDAGAQTLFSIETVVAGNGADIINLASTKFVLGNTFIDGGTGDDILWGNSGNDTINGDAGNDRINGGPGDDIIHGGDDNDVLDGGPGNDTVYGDAGNDTLIYTASENIGNTDVYDGGTGVDTLVLRLTAAQANTYAADIAAAQAFIAAHYNDTSSTGPSYTFTSFGLTISNIESIQVVITSDTAPNANRDDFTGTVNQPITGNVLADNGHGADSDADGDSLSVQAATITTTAGGQVSLNADGTFTYNPAANFYGTDNFTYTLLDTHGGSATGSVNLTISAAADTTPPSSGAQRSPSANAQGWNKNDVTVVISATDNTGGSGVKSITYSATGAQPISSTTLPGGWTGNNIIISTEGTTTINFHATDNAGNAESPDDSIAVKLDKTMPADNCASPDGLWHASDVSLACTAGDTVSGLTVAGDANFLLSTSVAANTETNNASTGSHSVYDVASNCVTAGPFAGNMVDKRAPSISITAPANGGAYLLNAAVASSYQCQDFGSGVQGCAGPVANGANSVTSSVGSKTFTVNATDRVSNASSASASYTVRYASGGTCYGGAGHQILQPINADGSSVFKAGSTAAAKFRVCDAQGVSVGSAGVVTSFNLIRIIAGTVVQTVDETVVSTTPDAAFRWDPTGQQWIFNISTKGMPTGQTYVYSIMLNDGSSIGFQFGLR